MGGHTRYAPLELEHDEPGFGLATRAHLTVAVWGRVARAADVEAISACQQRQVARYGCCQSMSIIRAGLSLHVPPEVREAATRNLEAIGAHNRGSATIVEAGGVRAAFFRSLVTSIQLVTFSAIPQKTFASIDEGLPWLRTLPNTDASALGASRELVATVYTLADAFGTPA